MYRATLLTLLLYASASQADNMIKTECLTIKRDGDRVSFSYAKRNEQDKPYFYAKVMMSGGDERLTLREIQRFGVDLVYLPETEPKLYQMPEGAKGLYLVKSKNRVAEFSQFARVVPVVTDKLDDKKKRNARNYLRFLPKERKITVENTLTSICSINLLENK